jgi:hypothetical protein
MGSPPPQKQPGESSYFYSPHFNIKVDGKKNNLQNKQEGRARSVARLLVHQQAMK